MKTKFYLCETCGNVIVKFIDSKVNVVCCGNQMHELIPSTEDSAREKHLPVVDLEEKGTVKVKVGSQLHPMTPDHHISFIYLESEHGGQVKYLMPDEAPEAVFFSCKDKPVAVYEYCNIHGLWKTEIPESCTRKSCCRKNSLGIMLASLLCLFSCSCSGQKVDNSTVANLDLGRYLGSWYEIARFDHSFERGLTHAKAEYALTNNGKISVTNSGIKDGEPKIASGKAKTTDKSGLLRVSFFGPFYSDYRVMMLSDDYNYALVGSGNSKYLWILSRTPVVPQDVLGKILSVASNRGYDISQLIWVDHSAQ